MRPVSKVAVAAFLAMAGCAPPAVPPTAIPAGMTSTASIPFLPTLESAVPPDPTLEPEVDLLPELAPVEYLIPPTLQYALPGGATVYFELAEESQVSILTAEQDAGSWRVAVSPAAGQRFLLPIQDLVPGETYEVAVGIPDSDGDYRAPSFLGDGWGPLRLHVPEASPASMRLVVIGDSGYGDAVTRELAVAAAAFAPDATLHLGDLVYRAEEEGSPRQAYARKFYLALQPLLESGPIYPVFGNHELDGGVQEQSGPFYYTAFPLLPDWCCGEDASPGRREWYRVAWGSWQFLFLNSQAFYGHGDLLPQNAWLDRRLSDPAFTATIPLMHVAPFSAGLHSQDGSPLRSAWHPRFAEAGVPLVLAGHDHNYERFFVDNVTYVVSGGGSAVLYARQTDLPGEITFAAQSHFLLIDLGSETLQVQAITEQGEVIDRYTWP